MNARLKIMFAGLMSLALVFGFFHLFVHSEVYNFDRLHVFLFNLCSGGTILLYYTEDQQKLTAKAWIFLGTAICYSVLAFLKIYIPAMILSLVLAGIVETVRIKHFSVFPIGFFDKDEPVYKKFHQASLLCLSIGLVMSSAVILNNEYLKIITMEKLQLDTFFLGFSFPLSLITMSVMFSLMKEEVPPLMKCMKVLGFWLVNLGVIIFFLFIIFEKLIPQVIVTMVLFFTVVMIFYLYYHLGNRLQQKSFLTSGIGFLLITAVTGILYIAMEFTTYYTPEGFKWLLKLHAFASLYGWNLCGLAVICRFHDFPIRLHSTGIIIFHWLTALVLAPLGTYFRLFSFVAVISYAIILYVILFSRGISDRENAATVDSV